MAVLSEEKRAAVSAEFIREKLENIGIVKADVRAAVDGLDDWLDANLSTINQAIPQPARGALTTTQKVWLFKYVLDRRFREGSDG
jgi:hypothetical protein